MDGDVRAVEGQTMLVDNRRDPYTMVEWNASLMSLAYLCGERDSTPRTGTQVQGSGYPCACNHHCQRWLISIRHRGTATADTVLLPHLRGC